MEKDDAMSVYYRTSAPAYRLAIQLFAEFAGELGVTPEQLQAQ